MSRFRDINFVKASQAGIAKGMSGKSTGRLGCMLSLSRVELLGGLKGECTTRGEVVLLMATKLPLGKTRVISPDAPILCVRLTTSLRCPPRRPHHNPWHRVFVPSPQNVLSIRLTPRNSGKEQNPYSALALRCKARARRLYRTPIEHPSRKRIFVVLAGRVGQRSKEKMHCRNRPIRRARLLVNP